MPELPEVESLRLGLEQVLIGQTILSVAVNKPKIVSQKNSKFSVFEWEKHQMEAQEIFQTRLIGQKFQGITRRAKNLMLEFVSGDLLLVHLKMTGQLVFVPKNDNRKAGINNFSDNVDQNVENLIKIEAKSLAKNKAKSQNSEEFSSSNFKQESNNLSAPKSQIAAKNESNLNQNLHGEIVFGGHPIEVLSLPNKHTHLILELSGGTLFYNDIRQFGYVRYLPKGSFDKAKHFAHLGVEPLSDDFTLADFAKKLQKIKSGVLKKILLDQKVVVGLGNIYCDEVCFAARVLPTRNVNTLSETEIERLFIETKRILALAVSEGGSSVANYLLVDGRRGNYADFHLVYGKYNQPCSVCGNFLEKTKIGGRTTVFCRVCQK